MCVFRDVSSNWEYTEMAGLVVAYGKCHPQFFKDSNGKDVTFLFLKELILYHESILCEKDMNVAKKFKSDQKYYRGEWLNKYKHIT